jgi:beta-galactosidase
LNDFESRWSLENNPHHENFDYMTELIRWYRPFQQRSIGVDIVSPEANLKGYRLVVVPHMVVLDEAREQALRTFVMQGGKLIVTCRTGVKDHDDALLPTRPPGPVLSELLGIEVEEYYALDRSAALKAKLFRGSAQKWAEKIKILNKTSVIATASYERFNGWLDEQPAITSRVVGRSGVYYVGCVLDDGALGKFVHHVLDINLIRPALKNLPTHVEVCTRIKPDGEKVYILINHSAENQLVPFPAGYFEHVTQGVYEGDVNMPPYSVAVLSKQVNEAGTSILGS